MKRQKSYSSWEEETYWKHFHTFHFTIILPSESDFNCGLVLPKTFTENLRANLPEEAILAAPNGVTWNVTITKDIKSDDLVLAGDDWKEFVKAYSLQKKDLLVFKYDRVKCFQVMIFDHKTCCESEASYFVSKSHERNGEFDVATNNRENNGADDAPRQARRTTRTKKSLPDHFSDFSTDSKGSDDSEEDDSVEAVVSRGRNSVPGQQNSTKKNGGTKSLGGNSDVPIKRRGNHDVDDAPRQTRRTNRTRKSLQDCLSDSSINTKNSGSKKNRKQVRYQSIRREVTEAQKTIAYNMAERNVTNSGFIVVMRPSFVYNRFHLVIPAAWKAKRYFKDRQDVFLRMEDKAWMVTFYASFNHGHGGLGGGWKEFAKDNLLEEFDVCVFEPSKQINEDYILYVRIFRAVPLAQPTVI